MSSAGQSVIDVGVRNGTIIALGDLSSDTSDQTIDAAGKTLKFTVELAASLRQALLRQGLQRFVTETVAPLNEEVGAAWMRGEKLTPATVQALRTTLLPRLTAADPQGFSRPFAALALAEVARVRAGVGAGAERERAQQQGSCPPHSGILPCFLRGFSCRLLRSSDRLRATARRVCSGAMTWSMKPSSAAL